MRLSMNEVKMRSRMSEASIKLDKTTKEEEDVLQEALGVLPSLSPVQPGPLAPASTRSGPVEVATCTCWDEVLKKGTWPAILSSQGPMVLVMT